MVRAMVRAMVACVVRVCDDEGMTEHHATSTDAPTTRVYIVSHTLTGYLPESAPYYTTDRDMAYAYALDELDARLDWHYQMPDEYRDDAWSAEVAQVEDMRTSCLAARTDGADAWSDQTIGAPYTTFNLESFECGSATTLAGWCECTLADLDLADDANVDDVCDALNREEW